MTRRDFYYWSHLKVTEEARWPPEWVSWIQWCFIKILSWRYLNPRTLHQIFIDLTICLLIYHIILDVTVKGLQSIGIFLTVSKLALGLWDPVKIQLHQTCLSLCYSSVDHLSNPYPWHLSEHVRQELQNALSEKGILLGITETSILLRSKPMYVIAKFYR